MRFNAMLTIILTGCTATGNIDTTVPGCDTAVPEDDTTEDTATDTGTDPDEGPTYVGMMLEDQLWIYHLDEDGNRRTFPEHTFYYTWEDSVDQVTLISQEDMATLPLVGNMTVQPGSIMVKIDSDNTVFWVEQHPTDVYTSVVRAIDNESVAAALVGPEWNDYILTVPDVWFVDFEVGSPITSDNYTSVVVDPDILKPADMLYEGAY